MARPFKRRITTYQLTDGRHRTPDGRRVTKATPGAVKVQKLSEVYYGKYRDADGVTRCVPLCADKTASKQMLAKLETDARLTTVGLVGRFEEYRRRPLAEHLNDYRRHLVAKGDCPEHVAKACARARAVIDGCRFVFIPDIDAGKVGDFLHELRRDPPRPVLPPEQEWFTPRELVAALNGERPPRLARMLRRERLAFTGNGKARRYPRATVEALQDRVCRGIGIATSNGYLTAIRGFTRWLTNALPQRWPNDPLAGLGRLNAKTDTRHERRALWEKELRELLAAAESSPDIVCGLNGPERALLYAVGMTTGLRAGELASLTPRSFDLAAELPTVRVRAAYSKNRREALQPLPSDVAIALRGFLVGRSETASVWPGNWSEDAAEMLRADLNRAGIPYRDADGRVCDFHALRHSYITLLSRNGVSPKVAQELARHSDIRLTMNVYTHAGLYDLAGAVEGLPALLPNRPTEAARASGTEGPIGAAESPARRAPRLHQTGDGACERLSVIENERRNGPAAGGHPNSLAVIAVESERTGLIAEEEELPGLDSNQDKENQNLLCYRYTTG